MIITSAHVGEGLRMFKRHLKVRAKHFTKHKGDATTICNSIISKLWNNNFLQTSLGNYPQFYSRDFGMVIESLLFLGLEKECYMTLEYALKIYSSNGKITSQITPAGKPINFPNVYSPDSLAYLLKSVRVLNNKELINMYKNFLEQEVLKFRKTVLSKTGVVLENKHFGGMRDHAIRNSSCYDTVMAAVVQREAKLLGLRNPLKNFDYKKILRSIYWNGEFFKDSVGNKALTADANIYPFWHNIITNKKMLISVVKKIEENGLDKPFPIKYVKNKNEKGKMIWLEAFSKDWESDAIWPMSGLPYIEVLAKVDKEKAFGHLKQYKELILKYGTFLEVFTNQGKPYKSLFYSCDEGMIWCAKWLELVKRLKVYS